jgi:hypothetical protein
MNSILKRALLAACIAATGLTVGSTAFAAREAADTSDKDAARQTTPDRTPQAAYQRKVKEIQAAHRDNLANCKTQPAAERSACVKEANQIRKSDLADAKQNKSGDMSGSSATGDQATSDSAKEAPAK